MMKGWSNEEALGVLANMHLQWFAEDDVDVDAADDVVVDVVDEDDEEPPILLEGKDEIPEDDDAPVGPDPSELQSKLAELEAQKQAYEARLQDREAMTSGFDKLASLMEKQQTSSQSAQAGPGESWDEVKKRLSKSFYDDPVAAMEEAMKYLVSNDIAPAFQNLQGEVAKTAQTTSRQAASANPTNKMIMERFGDEVEAAVKSLPASPDVYEKACQQVGMSHLTDIVQMQVEEATKTTAAKRPTSNMNPSAGPASRGNGRPSGAKRRVLTKQQQAEADKIGLSYEAYYNVVNG